MTGSTGAASRLGSLPLPVQWLAFLALGLAVYWPAFSGGPISDDYGLLMGPFVTDLSMDSVLALLDPRSQATLSLRNYAPVRPLIQAVQWQLFPQSSVLYHLTNVVVHALACALLVRLFVQAGVPFAAAALGGTFFAVHPANVEAVAWMSQIWGPAGLSLGLGALLAQQRRPALALALFGLAVLTRPTAVCLLPVAALREWSWSSSGDTDRRRWVWMVGWALVTAAYSAVQIAVFRDSGAAAEAPLHPDPLVRARTIVATAARYLVMAVTGTGVSAFHEPRPALSWLDPWWLLGVAAAVALGARGLVCLQRRREEAAFWIWAPAAFVPVSQLFPFLYPMSDRYLYFMLPGLLGGALLWGTEAAARLAPERRRAAGRAGAALAGVAIAALAVATLQRAAIWRSEDAILADAAQHYPDGVPANLLRARRAAAAGDLDAVLASIERMRARGWDYYGVLLQDPAFEPIRSHARFQAAIRDFAGANLEAARRRSRLTQLDWRDIADAHRIRGEWAESVDALERGIALGGPLDAELRTALGVARARAARTSGGSPP